MTDEELTALEDAAKKATPGRWEHSRDEMWASVTKYGFEIITSRMADRGKATNDAAFIAAANPQTVIALVAELRRLRGIVSEGEVEITSSQAEVDAFIGAVADSQARDTLKRQAAELDRLRPIVRALAATPAPRTVSLLGPTCGLCDGMLHGMVNQKPDMHSIDCPWRLAVEAEAGRK